MGPVIPSLGAKMLSQSQKQQNWQMVPMRTEVTRARDDNNGQKGEIGNVIAGLFEPKTTALT
jgi:hypothetical protein